MQYKDVLNKIDAINVECSIWSGRRSLKAEDIAISSDDLPGRDVVSLGAKKICNPDDLRVFQKLRKKADRVCDGFGIRFMGGYAIPVSVSDKVVSELAQIKTEFEDALEHFCTHYNQSIDDWITKHPSFEDALKKAVLPLSVVRNKFLFDYAVYKVEGSATAPQQLERQVGRMGGTLFDEIAKEAGDCLNQTFVGRSQLGQKTLSPIKRLLTKLECLSFLDSKALVICDYIRNLLGTLPKTGPIVGQQFSEVIGLMFILSDKDKMIAYAEANSNGVCVSQPQIVLPEAPAPVVSTVAVPDVPLSEIDKGMPDAEPEPEKKIEPASIPDAPAQQSSVFYF
ncbi:DUF3150 domain-containing protein [Kistimonas scapharcae]|uniref:DUF3150 domain-containing protein n=1 Tax=Kistimonas scapharcae TaxID=1036133 RepID=A0ABP8V0E3_9GAMM